VAQWVSRAPPHHTLPAFLNLNAIMTAAGGAAAAGIATALETRKVYEEEIEKFSIHFKTDHRSVLHVKYGLKQLELSKSEISKTEWTLNISAQNSFAWIIEVNFEYREII